MTDIDPATRRAARALGERLASAARDDSPRRASFTDVGTIEEVMADGTALVSYRGGTIGPLPMTTDCVCAARGRSCVIAIDGPIVRVIGIIARSSTDFELPASTITGTLGVSHGGTGATTAAGARSSLGVEQSPLLVNGRFHGTGSKYFLIAKSSLPTNDNACAGYVRVRADFGGWTAPTRTTVDVTVHLRSLDVSVVQCVPPASPGSLLQVKQDPSGYVWVYLWMSEEYYYASVRVDGEQFERLGTWGGEPSGDVKWTSSMYQSYTWRKRLYAGAMVGSGLKFHDGTLSVDNGAYVRLLWSGKTQSAVTLASSLANFRAILVTIGGSDDVAEGSTVVWSPNGKTFDVCAAFVVDTGNFRVMRMRLYGSGTSLNPTVVDGQNAGGYTSSTTYLHSVVGLV